LQQPNIKILSSSFKLSETPKPSASIIKRKTVKSPVSFDFDGPEPKKKEN
jgi:hypothetical protein